jgi:sugar (pentulose or hexulose) kinase
MSSLWVKTLENYIGKDVVVTDTNGTIYMGKALAILYNYNKIVIQEVPALNETQEKIRTIHNVANFFAYEEKYNEGKECDSLSQGDVNG